jgi:hypothetical protein
VELVKDGKVEVVYFPIPNAARETRSSLVIQELQNEVVDSAVRACGLWFISHSQFL